LPNAIKIIKSRGMKWEGHVACMEAARNAYWVLVENLEEKWSLEKHNVVGRIVLQWTLEKQDGEYGLDY
jgi:hypothetical protein